MQIRLPFRRIFLGPGKTFAVSTVAGARLRVVNGMVWATTSSSPDDVWLGANEEHTVQKPGLTVIESVARSTVELFLPASTGTWSRIIKRYRCESAAPRVASNIAAIAMAAITIGLLVVLPAKIESDGQGARARVASDIVATTPSESVVSPPGGSGEPREQASSSAAQATRFQR
jgi:Protein of unknown function (DUF2917)